MVIMNITDHLTRVQQQGSPDTQRVYGVLYGKQRGMAVEVCTSFELSYAPRDDGGITLDKKYLEENISLRETLSPVHADDAAFALSGLGIGDSRLRWRVLGTIKHIGSKCPPAIVAEPGIDALIDFWVHFPLLCHSEGGIY